MDGGLDEAGEEAKEGKMKVLTEDMAEEEGEGDVGERTAWSVSIRRGAPLAAQPDDEDEVASEEGIEEEEVALIW